MINRTRIVQLKDPQQRDGASNAKTMVLGDQELACAEMFHLAFINHYKGIRKVVEGYGRAGVAMIAVDRDGIAGSVCVAAKDDSANVAIIGRHGMTDLFLDGDPSLSLRHLVVILHPLAGNDEPRIRLVDLRTSSAFTDELGHRMEALEAEGPIFIGVGRYLVFFLPTGDETPWPDDAEAGWDCIPDRVYFANVPAEPDRWSRKRARHRFDGHFPQALPVADHEEEDGADLDGGLLAPPTEPHFDTSTGERRERAAREQSRLERSGEQQESSGEQQERSDARRQSGSAAPRRTIVQAISGPSRARRSLLGESEVPIGALRIRSNDGLSTIIVGQRAAAEGVLFGRYERCDNDGLTVLSNGRISRVHLLLISIASDIYAIDAASTNGLWLDGRERRLVKLSFGHKLMLGDQLAHIEWLRAH